MTSVVLLSKKVGNPTDQELARAYAEDDHFKYLDVGEISRTRTLIADWWPDDAQSKSRSLCGRFWVHQEGGKLFAFAPDTQKVVKLIFG